MYRGSSGSLEDRREFGLFSLGSPFLASPLLSASMKVPESPAFSYSRLPFDAKRKWPRLKAHRR